MNPRRCLLRRKPLRGLIAALILGLADAGGVRAQSATGEIGKAINADPQVASAAQAAEEALKTVATQGESTRGATGAIGQLITESDILICSAWILSFRTRYRQMVIEMNADGELDTQEAEALRAMERLMTVVEKACDKVLNREAYENLVAAEETTLATQASVPQVVCPECEELREAYEQGAKAYEQRSYEYQRAQLELSRAMGRTDFVDDVHGRNLLHSARDVDAPGRDQYTGYGLLDVRAALARDPRFFVEAKISGVRVASAGGQTVVEVSGTADADRFHAARLEVGAGAEPRGWTPVGQPLTSRVREAVIGSIPAAILAGAKEWTIRVITEHADGSRREARFSLKLG